MHRAGREKRAIRRSYGRGAGLRLKPLAAALLLALPGAAQAVNGVTAFAYVANNLSDTVSVINTTDNTTVATINVGANPWVAALSLDGSKAYVINRVGNTVSVINTATGAVSATVNVGTNPASGATSPDGGKVYVTNWGSNTVSVIDTVTGTVSATVNVGTGPTGVALSPDGSKAFVGNYNGNTVSVINTATGTVSATVNVGVNPEGIAISPDGSKAYVANWGSGTISVINTVTSTVSATINVGGAISGIAISPDGTKAYVTDFGFASGNTVSVINTTTGTVVATINVGTAPAGVAFSPDGSKAYVSNQFSNTISVIDTATNTVSATINVGSQPYNLGQFIGPNLITGNFTAGSDAALTAAGFGLNPAFGNSLNFAGGTLTATGSFTTSRPVYLSPAFNLGGGGFTSNAGGTVDTNGYNVTFSGVVSGPGSLTKAGAGTLTLSGANTYTGATAVNGGTLAVNGSITSNVTVGASGTLGGTGTVAGNVVANGAIAPGNSIGTLNVTGNATFNNGSTFRVEANSAGQADKLAVTGSTTINGGTVAVQAAAGTWNASTNYTILTSTGGVAGTFGGVTSNLAFLTPSLGYDANNVYLTLTRNSTSYATVASTPDSRGAATVLDAASSGASGDTANLITSLNSLSTPQAQAALQRLSGDTLPGQGAVGISLSDGFTGRLQDRWAAIGSVAPASANLANLKLAFNGNLADTFALLGRDDDGRPGWKNGLYAAGDGAMPDTGGTWVRAIGQWQQRDGDSAKGVAGSNTRTFGAQVGLDREVAPGTLVGASVAYGDTSLGYDASAASGTTRFWQAGAYALQRTGNWRLAGSVVYGSYSHKLDRSTLVGTAKSDYGAEAWTLHGQAAYLMPMDNGWRMEPSLALQSTWYRQDGFTETGAPGANLTVAAKTWNSLEATAGLRFAKPLGDPAKPIGEVGFNFGLRHEFGDIDNTLTASFASAPGAGTFTTTGVSRDRDALLVGAGFNRQTSRNVQVFASLDATSSAHENSQTLMGGVKVKW